jgi:hypothetical protein
VLPPHAFVFQGDPLSLLLELRRREGGKQEWFWLELSVRRLLSSRPRRRSTTAFRPIDPFPRTRLLASHERAYGHSCGSLRLRLGTQRCPNVHGCC